MGKKTFLLVVYDISNDRRRGKLHQALRDFGAPVQYSVFECWLDEEEQAQLRRVIRRIVRPKKGDAVRFYFLCATCVDKIEVLGGVDVTGPAPPAWVVGDGEGG